MRRQLRWLYFWQDGARQGAHQKSNHNAFGYDLNRTLDSIRPTYSFDVSCQGTVPEAIIAFLESESYEDAVRNAVSLGGDSDTLACIAGGIAEAFYGEIPLEITEQVKRTLTPTFGRSRRDSA